MKISFVQRFTHLLTERNSKLHGKLFMNDVCLSVYLNIVPPIYVYIYVYLG